MGKIVSNTPEENDETLRGTEIETQEKANQHYTKSKINVAIQDSIYSSTKPKKRRLNSILSKFELS